MQQQSNCVELATLEHPANGHERNDLVLPSEKMVKIKKKVGIMLIVSFFCLAFGVTCAVLWPSIFRDIIHKQFTLSPESINYKMWNATPVPMYLNIYLYNWTNHDKLYETPHFEQLGPYVFREIDYKVVKAWNENGTVTFQQRKNWHFEPTMSTGSLSDQVTNMNPITITMAYTLRNAEDHLKKLINLILKEVEGITLTASVKTILFDGYEDKLLKYAVKYKLTTIPYEKFAWFYARNDSKTYDGTFNMLTGSKNINELGMIKEWQFNNRSTYHPKSCGPIKGTNGDLWPPLPDNKTVSVFSPDVCTTLTLKADGTNEWLGLTGNKYISDAEMFDNGDKVPSRKCYCEDSQCQPSGTLNVSLCKWGAPAFVSLPHFYLADKSYLQNISGMNPQKEKHEFRLIVQPDTGVPLQVRAALQVNFLVEPEYGFKLFKDLPKMYVPMLWFTQEVNLTSEYASQVKLLLVLPPLGSGVSISVAILGILLIVISAFLFFRQKKEDDQKHLLSKNSSKDKDLDAAVNNEE
ncbi:protein croquemort-like isoform X2 [Phymastichus coffea]|uniref:protein croquemort-like isoform X2 n=1 Tax=Phymastichus coffea TaxID=108790 RepID=UPI00273A837B|nr:protein croquemort-like isoform X2 [Phymastichus coffea]